MLLDIKDKSGHPSAVLIGAVGYMDVGSAVDQVDSRVKQSTL